MMDETHLRVGDITVDLGRGRVMRGDTEVPLPKLSYDMLLVLARAAPNLLSIDALGEAVWPRLVISPETVSQRVKLLRDALGDDPKAPRYIGGLRGRGYQIVAPVERVSVEQRPGPSVSKAATTDAQPSISAGAVAAAASVAEPSTPGTALSSLETQPTLSPESTLAQPESTPRTLIRQLVTRPGVAITVALLSMGLIAAAIFLTGSRPDVKRTGTHQVASQAPFAPPPHSVAVLSFANMSGRNEDEYFSDGLAEELLATLVRISQLQVAARTSSFSFKGTTADIQTIGRKLNVGAVLEGSVRRSGNRVRITAQLINGITGFHLWSQTYDRDLKDVFALQTEIAVAVADALKVTLLADTRERLTDGGTSNPDAFDAYLRARKIVEMSLEELPLRKGIALFEQAIKLDPNYALAYAREAEALTALGNYWTGAKGIEEKNQLYARAKAYADKAIELAPSSGQVYGSLAVVLGTLGSDLGAIEAAYKRGLELEPGNSDLQAEYARIAVDLGRPDALAAANRAVTLNPLDPATHGGKAIVLLYTRRFNEARASMDEVLRLLDDGIGRSWMGVVELAAGRPAAALGFCERDRDAWYGQQCLAIAYYQLNRKPEAIALLKKLKAEQGNGGAYQFAQVHAQWGEKAQALQWLTTAVKFKDGGLIDIKVDPLLDPVREEKEFVEIVEGLNFPE
jgi:TolB-like protein/DNA-binding winged helix-turn-helix (wHTH) protein/Flp pilus assembly protein TadD